MTRRWPKSVTDLPEILPIFPLGQAIVLPRATLPLNIFEPRYLQMVDDALAGTRMIGMIQPKADNGGTLYRIGGAGRITALEETDDGRYLITLTGISRFAYEEDTDDNTPYRCAKIDWQPFVKDLSADDGPPVARDRLLDRLSLYLKRNNLEADWEAFRAAPDEPLVNALAMMAPVECAEKQALLEASDSKSRAEILVTLIELALAEDQGGPSSPLH